LSDTITKTPAHTRSIDVEEILKFADNLVFAKPGKYLDNVQKAILRGSWQDQKYAKIAEKLHRSEGHVRDIASELWKILSEVLGKEVNKSNFRSTLQRSHFSIISAHFQKNFVNINNVNVCANSVQSPEVPKDRSASTPIAENTQPHIHQDLETHQISAHFITVHLNRLPYKSGDYSNAAA
jgi:hypothetical protein